MKLNSDLFSTTFDNYHKRQKQVKNELNKINTEITKVTGRMTLMKYRIQKFMVEFQQALHKKSEVDKLLSFHLSTSLSHPKMGIEGYTYELERITDKYDKFRSKHINKVPNTLTTDVNVYFPEMNRLQVDHLEEIRNDTKNIMDTTHYEYKKNEIELFDNYQEKKHKMEWMMHNINNDNNININDRRKKILSIKNVLKKLETELITKISKSSSLSDLMNQVELINDMSINELKRMPIKLDEEPDDKPEIRFIKRKLVILNMKRNKCQQKIEQLSKDMEKNASNIDTQKLYDSAKQAGEFTHSVTQKRTIISKLRKDLKDMENYMAKLLDSRDILIEETTLLDNMESLTHNDIIYELIKRKPHKIYNDESNETFISLLPPECVVNDDSNIMNDYNMSEYNMTDISNLGDNLDIDNIDLDLINDEVIQILTNQNYELINTNSNFDESNFDEIDKVLDAETKEEFNKLKWNQKHLPSIEPNVFMEIQKNIQLDDLPNNTQTKLRELNDILIQNETDDFIKEFEKELNEFKNNRS